VIDGYGVKAMPGSIPERNSGFWFIVEIRKNRGSQKGYTKKVELILITLFGRIFSITKSGTKFATLPNNCDDDIFRPHICLLLVLNLNLCNLTLLLRI
jgi:hypothetical protein